MNKVGLLLLCNAVRLRLQEAKKCSRKAQVGTYDKGKQEGLLYAYETVLKMLEGESE